MTSKTIILLNLPASQLVLRDQYCSFVSKADYLWPPLDLLVQSGILAQKFKPVVLDAIAEKLSPAELLKRLCKHKPHGILFLSGTASWKEDFVFLRRLKKKLPQVLFLGSGGNLYFNFRQVLKNNSFIDGILLDFTSDESIAFFNRQTKGLTSLAVRSRKLPVAARLTTPKAEFSFPVPKHELFPLRLYNIPHAKSRPLTRVMASIGCPFSCRFCVSSQVRFRLRRIENVIDELKYVQSLGIKEVDFTDQTFAAVPAYGRKLCLEIIKAQLKLNWICRSRVDVLDFRLLKLMKKAGCHAVNLGVESGSPRLLKKYAKGITKRQIVKTFSACRRLKITTLAYFIIGLPGETKKTAEETINLAIELNPDYASFTVATPDYGTPLRREAIEKGWINKDEKEFDSTLNPLISTPQLSANDAFLLRRKAVRRFYLRPSYIIQKSLSLRSYRDFQQLISNGISLIRKS